MFKRFFSVFVLHAIFSVFVTFIFIIKDEEKQPFQTIMLLDGKEQQLFLKRSQRFETNPVSSSGTLLNFELLNYYNKHYGVINNINKAFTY